MDKILDYLFYCVQQSCEEAITVIEESCSNPSDKGLYQKVLFRLGTAIHWIMDCWERIGGPDAVKRPDIVIEVADKDFFIGIRYANNRLKHSQQTVCMQERILGKTYPYTYPYRYGTFYRWLTIERPEGDKYKNQFYHYKEYLDGKEVVKTLEDAKRIIEHYTSNTQKEN